MKNSKITLDVTLDDNNVPEEITWEASDKPADGSDNTNAFLLSLWDQNQQNTMRIDLWTKKMTVDEMKKFYVDSIGGMAESIKNATGDDFMAGEMHALCRKLVKHIEEERSKKQS